MNFKIIRKDINGDIINDDTTLKLPPKVENSLGRLIYQSAKRYYDNPKNRKAFDEWYLAEYGVAYVWKTFKKGSTE